jgi:cytochrome c-type biogenesis protein CcmE
MTPSRKLLIAGSVVVAVTLYMAYVGASASWKYYLTVDECVAGGAKFVGQRLRISGQVAAQSLHVSADRRQADFTLRGTTGAVHVVCAGTLPDNLAEDMEVVVEGRLAEGNRLQADKVLTRCASKYEAREAAANAENKDQTKPVRSS